MLKNIVVLVSGGGTNLQALIDAQQDGRITSGKISCVVSSNPGAFALERADKAGIPAVVVPRKNYGSREAYDAAILKCLKEQKADLIVLAGFMYVLGKTVVGAFDHRIINVHPALIPSFCGDGFYGLHVHEAALKYGVKVTGATVHYVNEVTDGGQIIAQKAVEVLAGDTPETLQRRVMEQAEWTLLPQAVEQVCREMIEKENKS